MAITCVLNFGGLIYAVFQATEINYLTTLLGVLSCITFSTALQILSKVYENQLLRITSKLLSTDPHLPNFVDNWITQKSEQQMEEKSGSGFLFLIFSLTVYMVCPQLYHFTKPEITLDHPDLQAIPFFHAYWRTDTFLKYMAKVIFEMFLCSASVISYWNFTTFMIYVVTNLETHIEEIRRLVSQAADENVKKYMSLEQFSMMYSTYKCDCYTFGRAPAKLKHDYEKSIKKEFVKIIKYHQFIHK